jgi:hypothetical protein
MKKQSLFLLVPVGVVAAAVLAATALGAPSATSSRAAVPGGLGAVVFQSSGRGGTGQDIWLRSPAGKLTNLTHSPASEGFPAVSPTAGGSRTSRTSQARSGST